MSGRLRIYKEKLDGYKKFYSIVKTIKQVAMAKYRLSMAHVKTRDFTLRYTEKCFNQPWIEEDVIKAADSTLLYIPITTNRGSCGSVNSNTYKYIESIISKHAKLVSVGKKGYDSLSKLFPTQYTYGMINDMKQPVHFGWASYVLENARTFENVARIQIIYTRFVSASQQRLAVYNIPSFEAWSKKLNEAASTDTDKERYSFANAVVNNDEKFVRDFYDFHATLAILNAATEHELSEYAARVVAVEGQLANIGELQRKTQHLYNKTRQGAITAALIEILSAMNALEGNSAKGVKRHKFWDAARV